MVVPESAVHYLEIVTPDPQATSTFYQKAYGWRFQPMQPELGNAFVAELPGGGLCGIRAPMHEMEKPIVRTYLRVEDVELATKRAEELGAEIALPPMDIPGRGRIAIYFIGGVEQGVWQLP